MNAIRDLQLWSFPSAEAQVAAIADDIAYDAHDIDDGLRAELFNLDDIATVPMVGAILDDLRRRYPGLDDGRLVSQLVRYLIAALIEDVVAQTDRRIAAALPRSADDIRSASAPMVGFSPVMAEADQGIKGFLYPRMYRHPRIMRTMTDAERVVRDLFSHYRERPQDMPPEWVEAFDPADAAARSRLVADFIAGMTDWYALTEHSRFFDSTPELR